MKLYPKECLVRTLRHPSVDDAVISQNAGYHVPVSPTERMLSKFTAPETKNEKLLLEEKFALISGEY